MSDQQSSLRRVSTVQRMTSATFGSLLTSLFVTPLDVIKVRLQVQEAAQFESISSSLSRKHTDFATVPPPTRPCDATGYVTTTTRISNSSFRVQIDSELGAKRVVNQVNDASDAHARRGRHERTEARVECNHKRQHSHQNHQHQRIVNTPVGKQHMTRRRWFAPFTLSPASNPQCTHFEFCNGLMDHMCLKERSRIFVANASRSRLDTSHGVPAAARPVRFYGVIDTALKLVRYEGASSLWSGLPPTLVMAVPATMLYFTAYDEIRYHMDLSPALQSVAGDHMSWVAPLLAGGIARSLAATLVSPLELARTQAQAAQGVHKRSQVIRQLLAQATSDWQGFRSLWRGLVPTLFRDVPFSMLYWVGYESLSRQLRTHTNMHTLGQSFVAGATSGMLAAIATTPWDVLKTRVQIEQYMVRECGSTLSRRTVRLPPLTSVSSLGAARSVLRHEGWRGFFTGWVPRVAKVAPSCAIMITTYEFGKSWFRQHNE